MKVFGVLLFLVGAVLLIGAAVSGVSLRWIEHPEATDRLLWIEHTWRMLGITAGFVGGLVLAGFGWVIVNEK